MKNYLKIVLFVLLLCGVFGADEKKSVMEGDSVTLTPDPTKIKGFIKIQWRFGDTLIAQIRETESSNKYEDEDIFRDRLQLDRQTGSLTIKNMRTEHSGLYKLQISHNTGTTYKIFNVTVNESPFVDAIQFVMKNESVTEGDPVALHVPQLQGDELIVWRFGDEGKLIAKHDIEAKSSPLYDETDGRFRGRLKLNNQTGSLIITNTRTTDSGLYTAKISSNKQTLYKRFTVTVTVPYTGVSPGAVAGIVVVVLLVAAVAVAAGVMYYCRPRSSNLPSQTLSVPAGDYVPLNPDTKIQTADEIQWLFGAEGTLIAEIKGETREMTTYRGPDMIFMNRLKLDKTIGSLTIKWIDTELTGLYTLKIRRGRETLYKKFIVFVRERMRPVMEGDPVTLNPDTEIQTDDEIQWLFKDEQQETLIAEIKTTEVTKYGPDGIFGDRLKLVKETGSLTITKFTAAHAGFYTLKIRRGRETLYKRFYIYEERKIAKMEGESVTLMRTTEINKDDLIRWQFVDEEQQTVIAEIKGETGEIFTYDVADGRFRDRLELDKTTGSLAIRNIRTEHSGLYKLEITSSSGVSEKTFIVTVKVKVEKKLLEGEESVTLNPDTEIQRDDQILWMFGAQDKLIAQIKGGTGEIYDYANKRFRGRLTLDRKTGSLTITNIEAEHTGLYKLQTISSSGGILYKKFSVLIPLRYVEGRKGESVRLHTGLTKIQTDDKIQWMFGDENSLIAEIKGGTEETYDGPDGRFRDSLELNNQTGDLTIRNSTAKHAGHYKLKIRSSKGNTNWTFIVNIRGGTVTNEVREKLSMKEKNDFTGKRVNESVNEMLLNEEDVDVVNEEEGTSSL